MNCNSTITIMKAKLLVPKPLENSRKQPKLLVATKSDKRLIYRDHKNPELKTTQTVRLNIRPPKQTHARKQTTPLTNLNTRAKTKPPNKSKTQPFSKTFQLLQQVNKLNKKRT